MDCAILTSSCQDKGEQHCRPPAIGRLKFEWGSLDFERWGAVSSGQPITHDLPLQVANTWYNYRLQAEI